jgi:hypothetical protein
MGRSDRLGTMKRLCTSADSAHLALLRSVLDAAHIQSEIRNEAVSQAIPGMSFAGEIWVADEDYDEASALVASNA